MPGFARILSTDPWAELRHLDRWCHPEGGSHQPPEDLGVLFPDISVRCERAFLSESEWIECESALAVVAAEVADALGLPFFSVNSIFDRLETLRSIRLNDNARIHTIHAFVSVSVLTIHNVPETEGTAHAADRMAALMRMHPECVFLIGNARLARSLRPEKSVSFVVAGHVPAILVDTLVSECRGDRVPENVADVGCGDEAAREMFSLLCNARLGEGLVIVTDKEIEKVEQEIYQGAFDSEVAAKTYRALRVRIKEMCR